MPHRIPLWYAVLSLALLWAGSIAAAAEPKAADRPNIVLFVADDHGQDAGCYGNRVIRTPNIDQLAREGTLYRFAFCTTASCSASRSVILSGLHNHLTGQYGHAHSYHHFVSFRSLQTLPVILARHGYRTARIGKYHVAPEEVYHFETVLPSFQGNRNPVRMAENCREFIAGKGKPFLLYFCTSDPHRGGGPRKDKPYQPDAFGNHLIHPGVREVVYDPKEVIVPLWMSDTPAARAELAEYYQSVSRVDQGLGRLVQLLKDAGQYENTLFIYTSDNGIAMPGAKTTLYEPGMRLPLIVRAPDAKRRGVVSRAMISWVDFTPTILDYAGVTDVLAPPLVQGEPEASGRKLPPGDKAPPKVSYTFHGRSFRHTLKEVETTGWNEVYGSHTFHEITMYYPMRVIRTRRYKLILNIAYQLPYPFASDLYRSATWQSVKDDPEQTRYGKRRITDFIHRPRYELYDLQTDPDEIKNIANDPNHAGVFHELARKLKEFQKQTRDPWYLKYEYE